jgi:hypothetical protein
MIPSSDALGFHDPLDVRPVPLERAAELAHLPIDVFALVVAGLADEPAGYNITVLTGPDGAPWFDPEECEGLGVVVDGMEGGAR